MSSFFELQNQVFPVIFSHILIHSVGMLVIQQQTVLAFEVSGSLLLQQRNHFHIYRYVNCSPQHTNTAYEFSIAAVPYADHVRRDLNATARHVSVRCMRLVVLQPGNFTTKVCARQQMEQEDGVLQYNLVFESWSGVQKLKLWNITASYMWSIDSVTS